jgi:cell division protein FtsB
MHAISKFVIGIIIFALVIGTGIALVKDKIAFSKHQKEYDKVHDELTRVQNENEILERYTKEENFNEFMEEQARVKFGYAFPGERIYYPKSN